MPREKRYSSRAEQQAAYRERQRAAQAEVEERQAESVMRVKLGIDDPVLDALVVAAESIAKPAPRSLPISEDEYVKLMLSEPAILDEKRAERYARWRYRGVVEGRVASL